MSRPNMMRFVIIGLMAVWPTVTCLLVTLSPNPRQSPSSWQTFQRSSAGTGKPERSLLSLRLHTSRAPNQPLLLPKIAVAEDSIAAVSPIPIPISLQSPLSLTTSQPMIELGSDIPKSGTTAALSRNSVFQIYSLLFCAAVIMAIDRVVMSVAVIPMTTELGFSDVESGAITSIFTVGYMAGLLPFGFVGSFADPKTVLLAAVSFWSVLHMASPLAASMSLPLLLVCRFLVGFAEGAMIPMIQQYVATWAAENERSKLLGFILSGMQIGNFAAFALSPPILASMQWRGLFNVYGFAGLLWCVLWQTTVHPKQLPPQIDFGKRGDVNSNVDISSIDSLNGSNDGNKNNGGSLLDNLTMFSSDLTDSLTSVPWQSIVKSKEVQAITVAHAVQNLGLYINLAWLPTYFHERFGLTVEECAMLSVWPWIGAAAMSALAGYVADLPAVADRLDRTVVRRGAQSMALLIPAAMLGQLCTNPALTASEASLGFVVASSCAAISTAGYESSIQDLCRSPKLIPIIYAASSIPAVLLGSVGVYGTGLVLDYLNKDWTLIFEGVGVIYLLGAAFYAKNFVAEKIFD